MSTWGKYLAEIVVPTGGWAFGYTYTGAHTETIPAGTYASILELCSTLEALLAATHPALTWVISVSEVGFVTIECDDAWVWTAATTNNDLEDVLGLDGTEVVAGLANTLAANLQHSHCWYPGTITYSYLTTRGVGPSSGVMWVAEDVAVRTWTGRGAQRTVVPSRAPTRRTLSYDLIRHEEARDHRCGIAGMRERYLASRWRWYPDRADGVVGAPGSEINPWTEYDPDDEYYTVSLAMAPAITERRGSGRWCSVELVLNGELA